MIKQIQYQGSNLPLVQNKTRGVAEDDAENDAKNDAEIGKDTDALSSLFASFIKALHDTHDSHTFVQLHFD